MKRIALLIFSALILAGINAKAQEPKDEVLLTIGNQNVTKSEFERIFKKNNDSYATATPQQIKEYLDLFIKFKLKVLEAQKQGYDTTKSFVKELAGYRKQLSKNYLNDNTVMDSLMRSAYERMQREVRASHILIKLERNAKPEDTLKAWNKIVETRKRIINGETFEKVARDVSEDPSVRINGGDLGYFTAFKMIPAFEKEAFNAKINEVSQPFRTDFGYHILKVTGSRNSQGEVKVAHILLLVPQEVLQDTLLKKTALIKEIYSKLQKGEDFAELAKKYSNDKGSAAKGGELPYFGTGRMIPQFEEQAFRLKNKGDISEPFQTAYGWHIIKLIDKKSVASFDDAKSELQRMVAPQAPAIGKKRLVKSLKKDYKYTEVSPIVTFYKIADTSLYSGKWDISKAKKLKKIQFSFAEQKIMQQDFAKFLAASKANGEEKSLEKYINKKYDEFVSQTLLKYEEDNLEKKYPDFRYLMQEYHDGILLFNITDDMVWSKAVKDTTGLEKYYELNKSNYKWTDRVDAEIFTCANKTIADKTRALLNEKTKSGLSNKEILSKVNIVDSISGLKIETGKFAKGDNRAVDLAGKSIGISQDLTIDNKVVIVVINKLLAQEVKTLNECKGLVTADYQNYLEEEWIKELKKKYPVNINDAVLSKVK